MKITNLILILYILFAGCQAPQEELPKEEPEPRPADKKLEISYSAQHLIFSAPKPIAEVDDKLIHVIHKTRGKLPPEDYSVILGGEGDIFIYLGTYPSVGDYFKISIDVNGLTYRDKSTEKQALETRFFPKDEGFHIVNSYPANFQRKIDDSRDMSFTFNSGIELLEGKTLRFRASFPGEHVLEIPNSELKRSEDGKTFIVSQKSFLTQDGGNRLKPDYLYSIYFNLKSENGEYFNDNVEFLYNPDISPPQMIADSLDLYFFRKELILDFDEGIALQDASLIHPVLGGFGKLPEQDYRVQVKGNKLVITLSEFPEIGQRFGIEIGVGGLSDTHGNKLDKAVTTTFVPRLKNFHIVNSYPANFQRGIDNSRDMSFTFNSRVELLKGENLKLDGFSPGSPIEKHVLEIPNSKLKRSEDGKTLIVPRKLLSTQDGRTVLKSDYRYSIYFRLKSENEEYFNDKVEFIYQDIFPPRVIADSLDLYFFRKELTLDFDEEISLQDASLIHPVLEGSGKLAKGDYRVQAKGKKLVITLNELPEIGQRFGIEIGVGGVSDTYGNKTDKAVTTSFVPRLRSFRIESSYPANFSQDYDIWESIWFTFSEEIRLIQGASVTLTGGPETYTFSGNNLQLSTDNRKITIPDSAFFSYPSSNSLYRNIPVGYAYIVNFSGVESRATREAFEGRMEFMIPQFKFQNNVREASEFTLETTPITWSGKTSFHLSRLDKHAELVKYAYAKGKGYTGSKVKVGVWDTGVKSDTNVYKAVVYAIISLPPKLMPSNHGTNMTRYLAKFSPGVHVYDLFLETIPIGASIWDNAVEFPKLGMDILSRSGSGISGHYTLFKTLIDNGLVLNTSSGNDWWYQNVSGALAGTESSYKHKEKFFPYLYDLSESKGAFVVVGSIGRKWLKDKGSNTKGSFSDWMPGDLDPVPDTRPNRARLGELKYFGVSLLEDGIGATSQNTAMFSGLVSILMEANEKLKAGFTSRELVRTIFETSTDIGATGVDGEFGWGIPNLEKAIKRLEKKEKPELADPYANLDSTISDFMKTAPYSALP